MEGVVLLTKFGLYAQVYGMSDKEIAEQIGVSVVSVNRWRTGERKPKIEYAIKVADLFGVPVEKIWDDEKEESKLDKEKLIEILSSGKDNDEIADELEKLVGEKRDVV